MSHLDTGSDTNVDAEQAGWLNTKQGGSALHWVEEESYSAAFSKMMKIMKSISHHGVEQQQLKLL